MRQVQVTAPGVASWVEVDKPVIGPKDVLVKMKAVGICGSDAMYTHNGGIPPRVGATPLGHELAGEVVEVGADVKGFAVGDHVIPCGGAAPSGRIGSGGALGGLSDFLIVEQAEDRVTLRGIPDHIPWQVVALNEPMAVAHHGVNRSGAKSGDKAVVFGAGPIGLGAVISLKDRGVEHVVVTDVLPGRLDKALRVGADAVVNSAEEDVLARLIELHGEGQNALGWGGRAGTDVFIDAAGVPQVVDTFMNAAKWKAVLSIVGVHKKPFEVDMGKVLTSEVDIRMSMGYPDEFFEVTESIIKNWEKYALIVSHTFPFEEALEALTFAATPGAADKVTILFE